ncbi:MAG: hypothetical protein O3C05_01325 [Proteobacteria bacterium]|nr:hypothetical protein [Pseudomonadota bacterium]
MSIYLLNENIEIKKSIKLSSGHYNQLNESNENSIIISIHALRYIVEQIKDIQNICSTDQDSDTQSFKKNNATELQTLHSKLKSTANIKKFLFKTDKVLELLKIFIDSCRESNAIALDGILIKCFDQLYFDVLLLKSSANQKHIIDALHLSEILLLAMENHIKRINQEYEKTNQKTEKLTTKVDCQVTC